MFNKKLIIVGVFITFFGSYYMFFHSMPKERKPNLTFLLGCMHGRLMFKSEGSGYYTSREENELTYTYEIRYAEAECRKLKEVKRSLGELND